MIISRQHFDLNKKTIIEKLVIQTPLKQSPVFQDEACYLYFKIGGTHITTATERVAVHQGESILLKCGSYFADIVHETANGICEVYVIHLFPDILEEIYQNEIPHFIKENKDDNYAQKIVHQKLIDHYIESLSFYFENPAIVKEDLLHLKLKELILLLLQTKEKSTIFDLFAQLFTPRKATLVEVIQAHLYSNLTLEQLAVLTSQSLSTFKRAFKEHFDDNPANYIRNKRMQKAAELLQHTALSIQEISFQIGYDDSSYFSRLFHRTFHVSPTEFRTDSQ